MRNLLLFITLISCLAGCSNEGNIVAIESISAKEKPLRIITRILTTKSANFVQEFKDGSEIGLLITRENDGGLYDEDSDYINVKAEANLISNKSPGNKRRKSPLTSTRPPCMPIIHISRK